MADTVRQVSWLSFALNLIGVAIVGFELVTTSLPAHPLWAVVFALVAVAAWLGRTIAAVVPGRGGSSLAFSIVMLLAGSVATAHTNGLAIVPVVLAIIAVVADLAHPLLLGIGLAFIAAVVAAVAAVPAGLPVLGLLAIEAGVVVAALVGVSRRQFREVEQQSALLREQQLAVREEKAQIDLLAQRQAVARDIHDLLAHSLGGLVIQLDAVEALLEAGDVQAALKRVTDARALAASGLSEARRAVGALRDPDAPRTVAPSIESFAATIDDLIAAHRSLGAAVELTETGERRELSAEQASALQRALQEALSNARKHAPGELVQAMLAWSVDDVRLTVSNPLGDETGTRRGALAATGGTNGLAGMRERFAALPLGGRAVADVDSGRFIVTVEASLV